MSKTIIYLILFQQPLEILSLLQHIVREISLIWKHMQKLPQVVLLFFLPTDGSCLQRALLTDVK